MHNIHRREIMNIRTDLALESFSANPLPEGVHLDKRGKAFDITEIVIDSDNFVNSIGKGRGTYITLEGESLSRFSDEYSDMVTELASELRKLIPEGEVLIAGLGNSDITPDALGPDVVSKVLATRHLRDELKDESDSFLTSLRPVSALAGGVLGQTGIETAELIRAVTGLIKPSAVIAVDSLACSDVSRLGTTIQITDSGISPGSGIANSRREISRKVLGIPVIAIGVPTVVDMHTIVRSLTGEDIDRELPNMIVTPKDIDRLTERASQLIAFGINLALHPQLSLEEVKGLF